MKVTRKKKKKKNMNPRLQLPCLNLHFFILDGCVNVLGRDPDEGFQWPFPALFFLVAIGESIHLAGSLSRSLLSY